MRRHIVIGLIGVALVAGSACASMSLQQNVNRAGGLRPGMSPAEVTRIMGGDPARSEFGDGIMEWHYCRTGYGVDQMVALFFVDNALIESSYYSVTLRDSGGATGGCNNFIKMGNYREPDRVTEIRLR